VQMLPPRVMHLFWGLLRFVFLRGLIGGMGFDWLRGFHGFWFCSASLAVPVTESYLCEITFLVCFHWIGSVFTTTYFTLFLRWLALPDVKGILFLFLFFP
jgi:hypothetical protein